MRVSESRASGLRSTDSAMPLITGAASSIAAGIAALDPAEQRADRGLAVREDGLGGMIFVGARPAARLRLGRGAGAARARRAGRRPAPRAGAGRRRVQMGERGRAGSSSGSIQTAVDVAALQRAKIVRLGRAGISISRRDDRTRTLPATG